MRERDNNFLTIKSDHPMNISSPAPSEDSSTLHYLPDSVRLIWSPNVTNCHMVGPVDSAGFCWSKC